MLMTDWQAAISTADPQRLPMSIHAEPCCCNMRRGLFSRQCPRAGSARLLRYANTES